MIEAKGANNLEVRKVNIKRIFNVIYQRKAMTKQDIAAALGLSLPTVSQILKDLSERGFVRKSGTLDSSGGRKPELYALAYDARVSLGLEVTQNYLRCVACDLGGNVLHHERVKERFSNEDAYYERLGILVGRFVEDWGIDEASLLGVGIAMPGIVLKPLRLVEFAPTLRIRNLPFDAIASHIPYNVDIDNEANLAGFAELWGHEEISDAVFLSINKGIGGAIIVNNRLYAGSNWRSGEFGHMTIVKDGKQCSCGKHGCLEAYCSIKVLAEKKAKDLDAFFAEVKKGNPECKAAWEEYLDYLATGLNNLRTAFDSDIIVGGDITPYIAPYMDRLQRLVQQRNPFGDGSKYLHLSKHNGMASAVGASLMLVDEFLATI